MDVLAFTGFFGDGKFADAVPAGLSLLGLAATQTGFGHLRLEFFERNSLLTAFTSQAEKRTENFQHQPNEETGQQRKPEGEAQTASAGMAQGIN